MNIARTVEQLTRISCGSMAVRAQFADEHHDKRPKARFTFYTLLASQAEAPASSRWEGSGEGRSGAAAPTARMRHTHPLREHPEGDGCTEELRCGERKALREDDADGDSADDEA